MADSKITQLNPDDIFVGENIRFGLKPYRIESLAESILQIGGVHTPLTVEKLKTPVEGKSHRLVFGGYRQAALSKLNSEQNAGLTAPCQVISELTERDRLLMQASENNERENMSPMDKAFAMQKMLSAGLSKMDVRKAFSSPGGRKGIKVQPLSNASVNMHLMFLDFGKDIQRKIHDGVIGIGAAYELSKQPKEKWNAILERAESERIKQLDREDKDEETYLKQNKALETAEAEVDTATKALEEARSLAETTKAVLEERTNATAEALKARMAARGEEKKQADEHFKASENEWKAAQKVANDAAKELEKLEGKAQTASEKAQAAKERLEAARNKKAAKKAEAKADPSAPVTGAEVRKAASKETGNKPQKLNFKEFLDAIKSLTILSSPTAKYQKTIAVGSLLEQCAGGIITDGQLHLAIARLVGEEKPAAVPAAPKKK